MQKFVLLASVASAAAFLAVPEEKPALVAEKRSRPDEKTPEEKIDEKTPECSLPPIQPAADHTFSPSARKKTTEKVKFALQKRGVTCPATGDNILGKKMNAGPLRQTKAKNNEFIQKCQEACHDNLDCAGLEFEYAETVSGYKTATKRRPINSRYKTAAQGIVKSCTMVKGAKLVQYVDVLKKAGIKDLTGKKANEEEARNVWVEAVNTMVSGLKAELGEDKKAFRAPDWDYSKAQKLAKTSPFSAVKELYKEYSNDAPYRCMTNENWVDGAEMEARELLQWAVEELESINMQTDTKSRPASLKIVKKQLEDRKDDLERLKKTDEEVEKLKADKNTAEEQHKEVSTKLAKQEDIVAKAKKGSAKSKNAQKESIYLKKQLTKVAEEITKFDAELELQANLKTIFGRYESAIMSAAAATVTPPVEPTVTPPVVPTVKPVTPPVTPKNTITKEKVTKEKEPCNKKLYLLLLLLLIPIGVGAFFICKSKKSSHEDDDL